MPNFYRSEEEHIMALVKYNPLRELRTMQEQMNQLLNLSWNHDLPGEEIKEGLWQPAVDIYETADSIVIKAELPDVDQKDIEVRIEDSTLILKGERKHEDDVKKENYHRIERYFGTFQRSFSLPTTVDQEQIEANCEKGVLTITLPKKEEKKPKQISIQVK
jgi:HSP20 family protein